MTSRPAEGGVVLVNVLVVLAIAGGLLVLLIANQDAAVDRVSRSADASIAEQIALGAEASVIDALRRDMDEAPDVDHLNEPWAQRVVQEAVELPTGTFSVSVADLQAKYDINQLAVLTAGSQDFARRLMIALDQPADLADQIGRILRAIGGVKQLDDLAAFGIPQAALDAMAPYVTALPIEGTINLNTVTPSLLAVMLQNDAHAQQIVRIREGQGEVTIAALRDAGILRPQNSGFTSDVYAVTVLAEAGRAKSALQTVLVRRDDLGRKSVDVLERRYLYDTPNPDSE